MGLFATIMFLHAVRYTLLTFVGNLFVDLLSAHSGFLAYVVFLGQKLDVRLSACFASLTFAVVFDVIGMLPFLLAAILGVQTGPGGGNPCGCGRPWV